MWFQDKMQYYCGFSNDVLHLPTARTLGLLRNSISFFFNNKNFLMNLGVFLFIFFYFLAIFFIYIFCVYMCRYFVEEREYWRSLFFIQKCYMSFMHGCLKYMCIWVGLQLWITAITSSSIIWFIFTIAWTALADVFLTAITDMLSHIIFTVLYSSQPYPEKGMGLCQRIATCRRLMIAMTFTIFFAWSAVAMAHGWVFFPKLITAAIVATILKIYKACSWVYKWLRGNG